MDVIKAIEILHQLQITIQKARSNAIEALAGHNEPTQAELEILETTIPTLFPRAGKIDLLHVVLKAQDIYGRTGTLEPIAMYNILFLADREPSIAMTYYVLWEEDLPNAEWAVVKDSLKALAQAAMKDAGLEDEE